MQDIFCFIYVDLVVSFVESGVQDVLVELDVMLIGFVLVKQCICEIVVLLLVDQVCRQMGLVIEMLMLYMFFIGNFGIGKIIVVLKMVSLLYWLGYVCKGYLVMVICDDLVGQYIGYIVFKIKEVLKKVMGGVLFIDEVYYFYCFENECDYGQEVIEILLQVMENNCDDLVVIFVGYGDWMDCFFVLNFGFWLCIVYYVEFFDYSDFELLYIVWQMLVVQNYVLDDVVVVVMIDYIVYCCCQLYFVNV